MKHTPDPVTSGAGARRGMSRRAVGPLVVAALVLAGTGLVIVSMTTTRPTPPPQPPPDAAPSFLESDVTIDPDSLDALGITAEDMLEVLPGLLGAVDTPKVDVSSLLSPEELASIAAEAKDGNTENSSSGSDSSGSDSKQEDSSGGGTSGGSSSRAEPPQGSAASTGMSRSLPTKVKVPRIGVDAEIIKVGLDADGALEVPPLEKGHLAGWYKGGPSPGEVGNSVVVGHVDTRDKGPAVFFELGKLKPGDTIQIDRKDGTTAKFVVEDVKAYPKTDFPTELVYGQTDQVGLRLITCGGEFDQASGQYKDNIIVFASLVS